MIGVLTNLSRKITVCEVSGRPFKRILAHFMGKIRRKPKASLVLLKNRFKRIKTQGKK